MKLMKDVVSQAEDFLKVYNSGLPLDQIIFILFSEFNKGEFESLYNTLGFVTGELEYSDEWDGDSWEQFILDIEKDVLQYLDNWKLLAEEPEEGLIP